MITADQLVAHAVGDYLLQSDWMATNKTRRSWPAAVHAVTYSAPFLLFSPSLLALVAIVVTHFVIDRWRLAAHVVWLKNLIGPWRRVDWQLVAPVPSWSECKATGYPPDRPAWLATWLTVIADNTLHVLVNGAALQWL